MRQRLGERLVAAGLITDAQLRSALEQQQSEGTRLGTQLLMNGWVDEAQLASFLSEQLQLPALHSLSEVDPRASEVLPSDIAIRHCMIPVRATSRGLVVAMADPSDEQAIAAARAATRMPVYAMVAPELVVTYGVRRFYSPDTSHEPHPEEAKPRFSREAIGTQSLSF